MDKDLGLQTGGLPETTRPGPTFAGLAGDAVGLG